MDREIRFGTGMKDSKIIIDIATDRDDGTPICHGADIGRLPEQTATP